MRGIVFNVVQKMAKDSRNFKELNDEILKERFIKILEKAETEDEIRVEATKSAYREFFGESYDDLCTRGVLYQLPNGLHKWLYNASWLNGHFQKGTDTILIKTPIDEESKRKRSTNPIF